MCYTLFQVKTLEMAQFEEDFEGKKNVCLEMKLLHAIHLAVTGTKMGIIQVSTVFKLTFLDEVII